MTATSHTGGSVQITVDDLNRWRRLMGEGEEGTNAVYFELGRLRSAAGPYGLGAHSLPGLGKMMEEAGELVQAAAKLISTDGRRTYWDGTDLIARLEDEMADVIATIRFFEAANDLDANRIDYRAREKLAKFIHWHDQQSGRGPK